ncbi:type II toxin-antitoxin system VapB family antitoxin [Gloeobacter morelensis]|uniref:Type II toxin-antitoxin system VapB family antitoxin n=1 Tax=Gloeobacter morelensis MG652769 TaxID=2781736 RepID=A0ABY3PRC7_9CYAN|nr:type II toxin-antitoxin system VapB family antitoxin [Gloeobacter morelensis]UFP96089.1 type II toxin-antitoxin system VapB family antitoxin [Gloeobacter morelensis MG652769]
MRTNVELDDALLEEAFQLTNVRTKKELLHLALRELIRTRKKRNLLDLSGHIQFAEDFDPKALRVDRYVSG